MTDDARPGAALSSLTERFDATRPRLHAIAQRMLGSASDADDAVQETWLRLARTDIDAIRNIDAWLTTVTSRVCLNVLRARTTKGETPLEVHLPDPIVQLAPDVDGPEAEAVLVDSVTLALAVVLETLPPAERVAFVLHDVFATPFDEIAVILDSSPAAARQLASRGRRRVRGDRPDDRSVDDPHRRRAVVDAFFRAARSGDIEGLIAVLDPEVVLRSDAGRGSPGTIERRGAPAVAGRAAMFAGPSRLTHPAWVNGDPGTVVTVGGDVVAVMRFAVLGGRIVAIEALNDPARLKALHVPVGPVDA